MEGPNQDGPTCALGQGGRPVGKVRADIHFAGGEVTTVSTARGETGHHRCVTDPDVVELVRTLAAEFSDEQIARIFHRNGLKTAKGLSLDRAGQEAADGGGCARGLCQGLLKTSINA